MLTFASFTPLFVLSRSTKQDSRSESSCQGKNCSRNFHQIKLVRKLLSCNIETQMRDEPHQTWLAWLGKSPCSALRSDKTALSITDKHQKYQNKAGRLHQAPAFSPCNSCELPSNFHSKPFCLSFKYSQNADGRESSCVKSIKDQNKSKVMLIIRWRRVVRGRVITKK